MRHLNLAKLPFTAIGFSRSNRDHRVKGDVPAWSFYASMEHVGHNVGKYFIVPIPRSIHPIELNETTYSEQYRSFEKQPVYVLPENSFNVVLPFQIILALQQQQGTLIFGSVYLDNPTIVEGQDLIIASDRNNFHLNKRFIFVAVLREGDKIVFRKKVWVKSSNPNDWGSQDETQIFTVSGQYQTTWRDYELHGTTDDAKRNIETGKWKLV